MFLRLSNENFTDPMQVLLVKILYLDLSQFHENLYLESRGVCLTHI